MHAIAGLTQDISNSRIAPNWRDSFTYYQDTLYADLSQQI